MNKRKIGAAWEQCAADYLTKEGMVIKARNYRNRQGEIDIIGMHQGYLVFVEVKYRKDTGKGYALEAVGLNKIRKICKVSDYYRLMNGIWDNMPIRYDVVGIQEGCEPCWIQNAFPHI